MVLQVLGSEEWFFVCTAHSKEFYSIHFATKELAQHSLDEHNKRAHKKM